MNLKDCCVLIPSLEPNEKLPNYVKKLLEGGFGQIIVIDDGSGAEYQPIFEDIASWDRCTVLHHPVNYGKGHALKTGFSHILENTSFGGVITADSDGQHTLPDARHLAEILQADREDLLIGSRDFSLKSTQVPARSRFGNRCTSVVFKLLYGRWLPDTQTGLRGISRKLLPDCLHIEGERFEYEMNQLMYCATHHIPMQVVPIETVYEQDNNEKSHFDTIKDSWRIYKLIFGNFFRFAGSSILSWIVDQGLYNLLFYVLLTGALAAQDTRSIVATIAARILSATVNYSLNRKFVFKSGEGVGKTVLRYFVLALGILALSAGLTALLGHIIPNWLAKVLIDLCLYLVSYRVQKAWVFADSKEDASK